MMTSGHARVGLHRGAGRWIARPPGAQVVVGDAAVAVALGPLGLGDRVPDRLRRRADVDAVDLGRVRSVGHGAHALSSWVLRSASAETRRSVYLSIQRSWIRRIGTGFRKCSFSRPDRRRDDEVRLLEHPQVLHDAEAGHLQLGLELGQRAAVAHEEAVEQEAAGRVGERLEHAVVVGHAVENR